MSRRVAVLLTALLAGCSVRVLPGDVSSAYSFEEVVAASGGRDLKVEVRNSPFAAPPDIVAAGLSEAMPRAAGAGTSFTATPANHDPLYRVVWDLQPGAAMTAFDLCSGSGGNSGVAGPIAHSFKAYVAYCRGVTPLTSAWGEIDGVNPPDDPALRDLVAAMTLELFPRGTALRRGPSR
jgi:hypothetical protein